MRRMTAERYRAWIQLLVDGNQNMIRIWGGGIYEPDDFYNICDGDHYMSIFYFVL
jgi:beta-mannosidase